MCKETVVRSVVALGGRFKEWGSGNYEGRAGSGERWLATDSFSIVAANFFLCIV